MLQKKEVRGLPCPREEGFSLARQLGGGYGIITYTRYSTVACGGADVRRLLEGLSRRPVPLT
jgi:hypothetical protein